VHALIIEPDAWIVFMIEDALRECGCTSFDIAVTGDEAVRLAKARCPKLITSALRLGGNCGIETVRTICSGAYIPVVFITTTAWKLREQLPDMAIVQKPFAPKDLVQAVCRARGLARAQPVAG
jgi:CheY-like chemotaxis protein